MIHYRYRNFSENTGKGSTANIAGNAIGVGLTGLMGYGMIQGHKQMKASEKEHQQNMAAMNQQTAAINKNLDAAEKSFAIPLLAGMGGAMGGAMGVASTGLMAGGMIQTHSQGKKQEKMNEEQIAAQERQTQAIQRQNAVLQRMQENGNSSPEKVAQVVNRNFSSVLNERFYGKLSGITTAARDILWAGRKGGMGKGLTSNIGFGLATGAVAYGAGKWISHDMKKSGIDIDNSGNLVQKQKSYADLVSGKGEIRQAKKKLSSQFSRLSKLGTPAICTAFEVPKVMGYYGEKRALKNQISNTTTNMGTVGQKTYSSILKKKNFNESLSQPYQQEDQEQQRRSGIGRKLAIGAGTLAALGTGLWAAKTGRLGRKVQNQPFFQHTRQTLSGWANVMGSFGVTSTKNVQGAAKHLSKGARSNTMRRFGDWAQNHKTAANLVALAPGTAIGMGTFGLAEKAVRNPMKVIDPDAYKYQDTKDAAANNIKTENNG